MSAQYQATLEAEKAKLQRILESSEVVNRHLVVRQLQDTLDQLNQLEQGENWTQTPSDTLSRIVLGDLSAGRKVIRS